VIPLPPAPLTREDAHLIWVAVGVAQYVPSAIELHGHKFRGWTLGTWSS
jgi:hypothetical protein